jgi:AbrB family looped-hinge helix DNA binding protein
MARISEEVARAELTATQDGRVTIPAQVRRAAGIEPGQILMVYVEGGRVVLDLGFENRATGYFDVGELTARELEAHIRDIAEPSSLTQPTQQGSTQHKE